MKDVYDLDPEREWVRLVKSPFNTIEFTVTMHYLWRYLDAGSMVLDAGGGPGRYTLALCRQGHNVSLMDLSDKLVDIAKHNLALEPESVRSRLLSAEVGDIRDLGRYRAAQFDAALCLGGPLSHLPMLEDRRTALHELARVVRPGGIVVVSVMGLLALMRTMLIQASDLLLDDACMERLKAGDHIIRGNPTHFFRAREISALCEEQGLRTLTVAGCEGIASNLTEQTNAIADDEQKWDRWLELVVRTSSEPSVADTSEHILYIGRKK